MDKEVWEQLFTSLAEQSRPAVSTAIQQNDTSTAWGHFVDAAEAALQILADRSPEGSEKEQRR